MRKRVDRAWMGLAAACAGALGLCACEGMNTEADIGGSVYLEAVSPQRATAMIPPLSRRGDDGPSLRADTLDRGHWEIRRLAVPVRGVEHRPIYSSGPAYASATARQRGEFPSLYSALEPGGAESAWEQVFEGLAWPFWAGLDLALMPARAVVDPPWGGQRSPLTRQLRVPSGTAAPSMLGDGTASAVPGIDVRPMVPPTSEPRWIWRNGKWYYWRPGDPEPWYVAPPEPSLPRTDVPASPGAPPEAVMPAPAPPVFVPGEAPRPLPPRWIFRDGKWIKVGGDQPPAERRP